MHLITHNRDRSEVIEHEIDQDTTHGFIDLGTMRMQWASSGVATDSGDTINLPAPFATADYVIIIAPQDILPLNNAYAATVRGRTTTSFIIDREDVASTNFPWNWIAIGKVP